MKDVIKNKCRLSIDKVDNDKNFIIIKVLKFIDSMKIYASPVPTIHSYFVSINDNDIKKISKGSFLQYDDGVSIEFKESIYKNNKGEEIISKWANPNQFDFENLIS